MLCRFARSFQYKTGRTDMGFVLDKRLWGGLPFTSTPTIVRLEVVYFDSEGGSFDVMAAAGGKDICRKLDSVDVGNSGRWRVINVTISDGRFGRSCPSKGGSADVVLRSTSEKDTVIQSLQIYKV